MRCRLSRTRSGRSGDGDAQRGDGVRRFRLHRSLHREAAGRTRASSCAWRCATPSAALFLKPMGAVGQVVPLYASLTNEPTVHRAVDGADLVVNTVGILAERRSGDFQRIHAEGAGLVARLAAAAGVARLVHISAIGADPHAASRYAATKGIGEAMLREAFAGATILRPSLVFGPEDALFNRFAGDGAPAAVHAGDLRRYAVPAGLCRRRGRRGDGRTGAAGCRRRGLRTRRTARLAVPRTAGLHPEGDRAEAADGRYADGHCAVAGALHGTGARQAADPRSVADAAAGQRGRRRRAGPAGTGHRADAGGTGGADLSAAVPAGRRHAPGAAGGARSATEPTCRFRRRTDSADAAWRDARA